MIEQHPPPLKSTKLPIRLWYVGAICLSIIALFAMSSMPGWGVAFVMVVTLFMLYYKSETSVLIILILVLSFEVFPFGMAQQNQDLLDFDDILFALIVGAFVAFSYRYIELDARLSSREHGERDSTFQREQYLQVSRLGSVIFKFPLAVFLGMIVLSIVPRIENRQLYFGLTTSGVRIIMLVWLLVILAAILGTTFSAIGWRKLTRSQARIFLRRIGAEQVGKEQFAIEKSRAKKLKVYRS